MGRPIIPTVLPDWATNPPASQDEIQDVALNGVPASGSFQLVVNGTPTAAIQWNDNAATIQGKINAVYAPADAVVTGSLAAQLIHVDFGAESQTNVILAMGIQANSLQTSGPAPITLTVTVSQAGQLPAIVPVDNTHTTQGWHFLEKMPFNFLNDWMNRAGEMFRYLLKAGFGMDMQRTWGYSFHQTGNFSTFAPPLVLSGVNETVAAGGGNSQALKLPANVSTNWGELLPASFFHFNGIDDEYFFAFEIPDGGAGAFFVGLIDSDPGDQHVDISLILNNRNGYGVFLRGGGFNPTAAANNGSASPSTVAFVPVVSNVMGIRITTIQNGGGASLIFQLYNLFGGGGAIPANLIDTQTITTNVPFHQLLSPIFYVTEVAAGSQPEIDLLESTMRFDVQ